MPLTHDLPTPGPERNVGRRPEGRAGSLSARRTRLARFLVGVWLAVHAIVVAGAPIADGLLGHGQVVAHWEDAQDTSCPPQHDLDSCQLCHQIATDIATGAVVQVSPVAVVRTAAALPADLGIAAQEAARRGAPDPRGPPLG